MATPATTPISRSMTFDSQLIEDFLQTDDILVDLSSKTPLTVFVNAQGDSEALVISKNSQGVDELYHVCREPMSDSGWNVFGVGAQSTASAVADSQTTWVIGTDGEIWRNSAGEWCQNVPALPDGAMPMKGSNTSVICPISVGSDGTVWVIDTNGNLYQYQVNSNNGEGAWQKVAGAPRLGQAPSGSAENFVTLSGGNVAHYSGGSWQSTSLAIFPPQQVSMGNDGSVFAIDSHSNLFQYVNQQWQQLETSMALMVIAVVSADNILAVNFGLSELTLVQYDGKTWQPIDQAPPLGKYFPSILVPQVSAARDGTFWCVDCSGNSWKYRIGKQASWQREMAPTGMSGATAAKGVTEVVVGQDKTGQQAFLVSGGTLQHLSLVGGTWRIVNPNLTTGCSNLGITHQQDTGSLIVYGVNDGGNMVVVAIGEVANFATYVAATFNANGILKGAKLQVNAMTSQAWFTIAVIGGQLCAQWGNASNPLAGPFNNSMYSGMMYQVTRLPDGSNAPGNLQEVIGVPWVETAAGFYCGVVDTNGNISMVFNINVNPSNQGVGSFIPLTGGQAQIAAPLTTVKSTSALIDAVGWTRIYATDANDKLWVVRQSGRGGDQNNPWSWTSWHPLGNDCLFLANGPGAQATRELFTVDTDSFLNHLSQDFVNLNWSSTQIRKPKDSVSDPSYVSQYVTEITVCDASGNAEPNVPVTVSVAEPVSVWVSGIQYNLDSSQSASFTTNMMGKVTFNTLAMDLHTAQLSFQAEGFTNPYLVYPPQNVHARLANVDSETLQNARARTQSVPIPADGPLVATANQPNCGSAATVIQNTFKIQSKNKIQPRAAGGTPLSPQEAYAAARAAWSAKLVSVQPVSLAMPGASLELGSWDSFWHDLATFGEDVWHGIRKGILAVENVVVHVDQGLIELTLSLENVGKAVISYVIKAMDDVVHAVASAFRWLGTEVEKAIDWLKEFFSWSDILNTKTVMEYYVNQVFSNLSQSLDPNSQNNVQQLFKAQFGNLMALIVGDPDKPGSDAFSQSQQAFGSNSFNGSVSNVPYDSKSGKNALQPDNVHQTYKAHQVKSNYARTKTETYVQRGGSVAPSGSALALKAGTGSFEDILDLIVQKLDTNNPNSAFNQAHATLQSNLKGLHDPKGLFESGVNDFVILFKEIVLVVMEVVEEIMEALMDLAGAALASFQAMLNHQLHIPIISWLYQKISDHPLTLADLLCLVMSIPATLIYKLIWGGSTASPPFTSDQVTRIVSQQIPWPMIDGTGLGMTMPHGALLQNALGAEKPSDLVIVLGILSVLNGILYSFVDIATDIDAVSEPGEGCDISTWMSALSIFFSVAGMGYSTPYEIFEKQADKRTKADLLCVALWAANLLPIVLNIGSFAVAKGEKRKFIAKYWPAIGPLSVIVVGIVQFALGLVSANQFSEANSGYNAAYSVGAIITPVPSLAKVLIAFKTQEMLIVLCALDLICDIGSGSCTLAEAITS